MFETLLLGIGVGVIGILVPGPVTLAIIEIGSSRGRRLGARAGLGVAGADFAVGALAFAIVGAGSHLPAGATGPIQLLSTATLVVLGVGLVVSPGLGGALVAQFRHPFRSMFALTALTPSVFGAWIAMFAAMPFANDIVRLAVFGLGGVLVSVVWHLGLGTAAGSLGSTLTPDRRIVLARIGGLTMLGLAGFTLV